MRAHARGAVQWPRPRIAEHAPIDPVQELDRDALRASRTVLRIALAGADALTRPALMASELPDACRMGPALEHASPLQSDERPGCQLIHSRVTLWALQPLHKKGSTMRRMTRSLAIALMTCSALPALASAPTAQADERPASYTHALDLIHAYSGSGGELRLAMTMIDHLARTHPKSGYAQALFAEALSTWQLDQDGTPEAVRDQVLALADEALTMNPALAQAHVAKGRALLRASRYDEATASVDAALELEPQSTGALFLRADMHRRQGAIEEAEKWYMAFIESTPSPNRKGNGYGWIAHMYFTAADEDEQNRSVYNDKARRAFENGLRIRPDGAWTNVNFAVFLNDHIADFEAAEQYALRALSLMEFPMARYHLAAARYQKLLANHSLDRGALRNALEDVHASTGLSLDDTRAFESFSSVVQARLDELHARARSTELL